MNLSYQFSLAWLILSHFFAAQISSIASQAHIHTIFIRAFFIVKLLGRNSQKN